MATVPYTLTESSDDLYISAQWTLANTDDGTPLEAVLYADRSVQITGAGTLIIEGSNDGTNYVTLKDPLGNNITGAGIKTVAELVRLIRPRSTSGAGVVTLVARKA